MSAWYIFSALGCYPVNPVSGGFVAGEPQVSKVLTPLPFLELAGSHAELLLETL